MSERRSIRPGYYWEPQQRVAGGAPSSYDELLRDYHRLVMAIAHKAGLSGPDAEDAAQTVELRFWLRGGLEDYDPERLFEPPAAGWDDGKAAVARPARFATMFKTFVILSMRGERDRAQRWYERHVGDDEVPETLSDDPSEMIVAAESARGWLQRAHDALVEAKQPQWAAAVVAAAQGQLERREDWAAVLGCKVRSSAWAREQLGMHLLAVGMGPETLRRAV